MSINVDKFQITSLLARLKYFNSILNYSAYLFFKTLRFFIPKNKKGGVVIISLNKIGDSVFTFPAVQALIDHYPNKEITILSYKSGEDIYRKFFNNTRHAVLSQEMFSFGNRWANFEARKVLRDLHPEIIVDLTACMTSAALLINSRARLIYGINKEIFKGIYTAFSKIRTEPHLTDLYLDAVKLVVNNTEKYNTGLYTAAYNSTGKILLHPFAGWKAKEWELKRFIQLAEKLRENYNVEFVVEDNSLSDEVLEELNSLKIQVRFTSNIADLIDEIIKCSVMISNDTGCIQLAAVLGKATFTIYGPTNPHFSVPAGRHHAYIRKIIKCSPDKEQYCFTFAGQNGCPSFQCMEQLTLDEVLEGVKNHLQTLSIK